MKLHTLLLCSALTLGCGLLAGLGGPTAPEALAKNMVEVYKVDPGHTSVLFRVKHLGIAYFYGRFNRTSGGIRFDEGNPKNCSVELEIDATSIDTNDEKRDLHMKSEEFFHVSEHPTAKFVSQKIKKLKGDAYQVQGELTLRGVSKQVTCELTHTGKGDTFFKDYRRGFETSFTVARSEFGMTALMNGLDDEVEITIAVEAIRQEPEGQ